MQRVDKPHILLFTDSENPSGMGQQMLHLAEELVPDYKVSFLCWDGTELFKRAEERCFSTYAIPASQSLLVELLQRLKPDIFHCHAGIGWEGHWAIRAAKESGLPHIVRTEHLPFLVTETWQRDEYFSTLELIDTVICVSEQACSTYLKERIPVSKLRSVKNGVPVWNADGKSSNILDELKLPGNTELVLTVGRMTEQKGYTYLVEAAAKVVAKRSTVHFLLAGLGPLEGELRSQAKALGIEEHIHFLGHRPDIKHLMSICKLFVLPSLFEGLPLVVLEAMSCARPVVGTDVCGTNEAVEDGVTGLLVPAKDTEALSKAILRVISSPDLQSRFGNAGKQRLLNHFSAERMGRETAQIYADLLGAGEGRAGSVVVGKSSTTVAQKRRFAHGS